MQPKGINPQTSTPIPNKKETNKSNENARKRLQAMIRLRYLSSMRNVNYRWNGNLIMHLVWPTSITDGIESLSCIQCGQRQLQMEWKAYHASSVA